MSKAPVAKKTTARARKRTPEPVTTPARPRGLVAARPRSLTAQAYERIEEMIVKLELQPGTALSEAELSARLGIGRTPVREALFRLEREGYLEVRQRNGWLVKPLDFDTLDHFYELRSVLENQQLAVIDFQDIVIGPVSYDAVSLLKDCYKRWPDAFVAQQRDEFFQQLQQNGVLDQTWTPEQFARCFDLMGLQRHIKVCGIFSRLYHRDNKAGYLADLPRVLDYIFDSAAIYPECQAFSILLRQKIQPRLREVMACGQ